MATFKALYNFHFKKTGKHYKVGEEVKEAPEDIKALAVGDNAAEKPVIALFLDKEDVEKEEYAHLFEEEALEALKKLSNDELKVKLDEAGIEYKAKDNKDVLIEKLTKEGE